MPLIPIDSTRAAKFGISQRESRPELGLVTAPGARIDRPCTTRDDWFCDTDRSLPSG
jgi:hypothetical protein